MVQVAVMPRLGAWLKEVGDAAEVGEPLFEVQTDKVNIKVESLFSGVVLERVAEVGQVLPVGAPVAIIGKPEEAYDRAADPSQAPARPTAAWGQNGLVL